MHVHNAMKSTGTFVAQRQPLLMFAVSRGPCLLVQYSADDFRFLLTLFKKRSSKYFPSPTRHTPHQASNFFFYFCAPKFYKLSEVKGSDL
jgi:hypothetical protein